MSLQRPQALVEAETLHHACLAKYQELKHQATAFYSPMVVSKLLMLLKDLRLSLEKLQSLPMKIQEETAWITLNACKLILDIAQPLIWYNCGKYVAETLTFAALSMEAVINLCTVRHMHFRMKLYSSIFYAVMIQGSTDEGQAIWDHCNKQINELKERELLDPPLPQESIDCLTKCAEDLNILKFVLDIWRDNEAIDFSSKGTDKYITLVKDMALGVTTGYTLDTENFRFRILNETFRIHHLCSGNMNESYLKRSSHMIKAVENILPNIDLEKLDENVVSSIYEMASLAILDQDEIPATLCSQLKVLVSQLSKSNDSEGNFKEKLNFLIQAQEMLLLSHDDSKYLDHLSRFSTEIHRMVFVDSSYLSRSFFGKFAAAVVRKSIYEPLQRLLSSSQPVEHKILSDIGAGLTFVVKNLESVFAQDSIFFATLVTLNVNILVTIEDFRGAISIARRGLTILEDHRAARVDFHAMLPEDVRDVMALQRQSFTTRSDSSDWYHAVKRLGAHAFAGFGIFGLGSSSDRSDQALAEIHAELLALYFRTELRYGISHYLLRKTLLLKNKEIEMVKAAALKENPNMKMNTTDKGKEKTIKPGASKPILAGTVSNLNTSVDLSNNSTTVSVPKLPIFNSLKILCAKNPYAQCVLMMEAAKLEQDTLQRHSFLEQAFSAVRDAENDEAKLLEHFNSYTLLTHEERHHPIVVSRTHRYIYVAPVACRKLKHISYYKIHAKEKGSGTEVSIYNTDLPGSQKRVEMQSLTNFRDSVVRIGPLRNGELYMFGSVGYNAQDTIVGGVSPSTMAVSAVNPLPTILLWSLLGQAAQVLQEPRISMEASWRVCCRFFQSMPIREAFSVTSGNNLFVYDEPVICTLAVQQSTPVILHHFVASLLRYESLHYQEEKFGTQTNWNYRKGDQLRYLMPLERFGAVASIVGSLQNQDLTIQLLLLSELLVDELLRYDMAHLSRKMQSAVMSLLMCLQRISKRNWHDAEHRLYYKFCVTLVQLAMLNKSLTPVVSILADFFLEAREKSISSLVYPSANVVKELGGLIRYADIVLGDSTKASMLNDAKLLLSSDQYKKNTEGIENIHDFWKLPDVIRYFKLSKMARDLISPPPTPSADLLEIEKALIQEQPIHFSDYLSVILQLMLELNQLEEYSSLAKVIYKFPICKEYLASDIQTSHEHWSMTLCVSLDKFVDMKTAVAQPVTAAAGGKKAPPPKKGAAPEVEPTPAVDWSKIPDRYLQPNADEIQKQRSQIGEIVVLLALVHEKTRGTVNVFVRSHRGMLKRIVPNQEMIRNETKKPLVLASSCYDITGEEVVARLAWSVALFTQAGMAESACNALLRLWNFLVAEYIDPNQFTTTFSSLESTVNSLVSTLTDLIEKIGLTSPSLTGTLSGSVTNVDMDTLKLLEKPVQPSTYQQRDMLVLFRAIIHPLIYAIKVQWLYHEHPEDTVLQCSRLFQVFAKYDPSNCLKLFCEEIWSLVNEAQETLINQAADKVNEAKQNLEKYVSDYEEAQRKKRKKKLRIARTEKDEEELIFEAEKNKLEEIISLAETKLAGREVEMVEVQNKLTYFQETLTKGAQLARVTKEKLFGFISHIGRRYGSGLDWRRLLSGSASDDEILAMFTDLRRSFERTSRFLREKKERLLLVEVLEDYTNVLIRFGLFVDVEQYLNDVVDGLFNAMDACMNWKSVIQGASQPDFDLTLVPGFPFVMSALGKLSKYCALNDYDRKSGYARMSSEITMLMFQESLGHPVNKLGMAGYECIDLGGYNSISPHIHHSWFQAIEEHILVLFTEAAYLDILPLVVLGEYLAAIFLRSMRLWLQMRIHRIRALIRQRFFSEAIAMYTGIRPTVEKMSKHVYGDILRQTKASDTTNTTAYDACANDLNYFGKPSVFYNNFLPGDEKFNSKALDWMTTAPAELEAFLSSFTIIVPESDLSPEQRQRMEVEKKIKAEADAAAAASNKKGAKPPAKGLAVAEEKTPAYDGPRVPIFAQSQIVQMYLLSGQLLAEISTIDAHQVPKHAVVAEKWATKASLLLQQAKEYLFTRFTESTKQVDIAEFFLRVLHQPEADVDVNEQGNAECKAAISPRNSELSDSNQELYANYFLRVMRTDKEWLYCYREIFTCEQSLFMYRRKYREILASVTRLGKLFAHPLFQQFSTGDQQFQLMEFWFQCKWYHVLALEGQANRSAVIACITEAIMPCCQAMRSSHWKRTFLHQRASAYRVLKELSPASKDMDQVLSSFTEHHDLESVALVQALILRATLLQEELQCLRGSDNKVCLESYHKHQKTLQMLRRAAEIGQRLGVQSGMFTPDTNITFQLQPLDYQYAQSETSKNESFSGAVSGYHLLNPALYAFTDIHDNAPPLSITAAEAAENTDKMHHTPWQRLRLGPVDSIQSTTTSISSLTEEAAFISVHPANVYCNIYLKESRVLLLAQMALLQLLDDLRNKDIHRLRHVTRQNKLKIAHGNNVDDDDEKGPFDPKLLQMEEVYLVEYVLKLMRQVVFVSPVLRARAYYFAARARMSSNSPQGYADLRAHVPVTSATLAATTPSAIPPIIMQVQLTPIVAAMKLLTHARATHVWSLLKRLCLEVVHYFGQGGVAEAVEEQGVGDKHEVLRQAAQYLLLASLVSSQRSKLRHGISDLVESGAELNVVMTNELLTQWATQCFTSSMSAHVPSPAEIAVSQAAAAAAAAAPAGGKGGKAAAPGKGASANAAVPVGVSGLTGRDAIALLVTCLREQAELEDVRVDATDAERWVEDLPAISLSLDLHMLLQQIFPSSYGAQCALTTGQLPEGELLPLLAAQSALQGPTAHGSSSQTATQSISAGSVTAVWDSMVATPEEWVKMHSDIVTGKWFTLDGQYGLYSHAALYLLLGDHLAVSATPAAPVVAAPPAKGGKGPAANAATTSNNAIPTDSKDPVLTRIVLYKGDIDHCERRLRQLAFDLQFPRDVSAVTGDAIAQAEGKCFFANPSPSYFASLVWAVYTLLKRGFVGEEYWQQVAAQFDHVSTLHNLTPVIYAGEWDTSSLIFHAASDPPPVSPRSATGAAPASPRLQTLQQMQTPQKPPPPLTGSVVITRNATDLMGMSLEQQVIINMPYSVQSVKQLADILNRTRDQAMVSQPEICNFLRMVLGYSAPIVSARAK